MKPSINLLSVCFGLILVALPLGFALLFAPVALTGCKTLDSILTNAPPPTVNVSGNSGPVTVTVNGRRGK